MKRMIVALATLGVIVGLAAFAACRQGKGDRCQTTSDCDHGLTCSAATGTCVGAGAIDPIDAVVPPMDVIKLDGPPDAIPDASTPLD